ncbi:uncharacterized protein [Argopecten irradians]|uniref:uncharacterized protein n=1 Tax=Argopecten irradians TaxID=31199 RepID=UPI0037245703
MMFQLLQKTDDMEDSESSSSSPYNEEECKEKTFPKRETDKLARTCDSEKQQSSETNNIIASAQTQTETECTLSENQSESSVDDLYNIGSKPQEVFTSISQSPTQGRQTQVSIMHSKHFSSTDVSTRLPFTPSVPSAIVLADQYKKLEDYFHNDSSDAAIEIQSSPEKESVTHLTLKRSYNRGEDSDVGPHNSVQCSTSPDIPDRPRAVTTKFQLNSDSSFLISDVSDDGASPQVNKESKQTKAETKPPLQLSRSQKNATEGDSGMCMDFENKTSTPSGSKGMKYFETPPGDKTGEQTISMASISQSKEQVISLGQENDDSTEPDTTINEYIDKMIEWFPDACRMWIKKRIETIMHRRKEVHLDDLASSMVDGLYPKSSQNEAVSEPENYANVNNGIKPSLSVRGHIESDSSSNTKTRRKVPWLKHIEDWDLESKPVLLKDTYDKDPEPPSYWHQMSQKCDKDYLIVTLEEKCEEYRHIKTLFSVSMACRGITAIRRVQNPHLWHRLCLTRKHMIEDFGLDQLNERHLFHGTKIRNFDPICREGLDWRKCKYGAFGQGTYFAKFASVSDAYCGNLFGPMMRRLKLRRLRGRDINVPPSTVKRSTQFAQDLNLPPSTYSTSGPINQPFKLVGALDLEQQHSVGDLNSAQRLLQKPQESYMMKMQHQRQQILEDQSDTRHQTDDRFQQQVQKRNSMIRTFKYFSPSISITQNNLFPQCAQSNDNVLHATAPEQAMTTQCASSSTNKVIFTDVADTINSTKKNYMFVARVLVGRCCAGNRNLLTPPADPDDPERRPFNSCVNNVVKPSTFVTFDSSQSYPEYIVEYTLS